jgi:hypothetical protein
VDLRDNISALPGKTAAPAIAPSEWLKQTTNLFPRAFCGGQVSGFFDFALDQSQNPVRQASAVVFSEVFSLLLQIRIDPDIDDLFFWHRPGFIIYGWSF